MNNVSRQFLNRDWLYIFQRASLPFQSIRRNVHLYACVCVFAIVCIPWVSPNIPAASINFLDVHTAAFCVLNIFAKVRKSRHFCIICKKGVNCIIYSEITIHKFSLVIYERKNILKMCILQIF